MTILVTGGTGKVGSETVSQLVARGASVRVLSRDPNAAKLQQGATLVQGDFSDVSSLRAAMQGVDTLFLLNPVVPDELFQAMLALNLAEEAGITRLVYLSVLGTGWLADVPHVASKLPVEAMIAERGFSATILRATLFMQNDLTLQGALAGGGYYPMPIGEKGVAMVDVRDVGEAAAIELIRRDGATELFPTSELVVCGPQALTGTGVAGIWAGVLGRDITYAGNDLAAFEKAMVGLGTPQWLAYDLRMMFRGMQARGQADPKAVARLSEVLGRPPRAYRDFAKEALAAWGRDAITVR